MVDAKKKLKLHLTFTIHFAYTHDVMPQHLAVEGLERCSFVWRKANKRGAGWL
jgi:hypothetical protein